MNDNIKVTPEFAYRVLQARQRRDKRAGMEETGFAEQAKLYAIGLTAEQFKATLETMAETDDLSKKVTELRERFQVLHVKAKRTKSKKKANQYYKEASELFVEAEAAAKRLAEIDKSLVNRG